MNTKTLLAAFTLILLFAHFNAGASTKQIFNFENKVNQNVPHSDNQRNDRPLSNGFDLFYDVQKADNETGHDHETHQFHYDRFHKNRNRLLLIIGIKLLLFIAHLSTFLLTTIHFLH